MDRELVERLGYQVGYAKQGPIPPYIFELAALIAEECAKVAEREVMITPDEIAHAIRERFKP